ncbi:Internalin-J precursor [Flavobacterium sp. ACN6]|nr:Internalin-J precursor [Flavobacterium sp. ACN6]
MPDNRNEWFKGTIDDVGIWNRVLTPEEIMGLYTSQMDDSYYTAIPDPNFEQKLINLGIDVDGKNGKVLNESIANITSLNVNASSIKDLTGISGFTSLKGLNADYNELTTLDLSKNIVLDTLRCEKNKLRSLNLKNGNNKKFYSLGSNFSNNPELTCIQVDEVAFANTNWAVKKDQNAQYNTDCPIAYTLIPDPNFEKELIRLGIDKDGLNGKVVTSDVSVVKSLNMINKDITDLTGIADFTSLESLSVANNSLSLLDISKNTNLKSFNCNSNKLETLNVSSNNALTYLSCFDNKLKILDISNNPSLVSLECENNQLTLLDASKNASLMTLRCSSNQLSSLNVKNGNNTILGSSPNFEVDFRNNPNLTCIQVDDATFSNLKWAGRKDAIASYNTSCESGYIALKDPNFEKKLIELGIDTDGLNGKITTNNVLSITSLDLSNSNIKDLTGIEYFTQLKTLDVSNNQLTHLDLSQNTLLEVLNASLNQIAALDLSKNINLKVIYVVANPLTDLNVKNGNNKNFVIASATGKQTASNLTTTFLGLKTLSCITVDDANYANANWSTIKESSTSYSAKCTLGIEDSVFDKAVIYPNPTKGEVHINNIVLEKANVYNSLGQLVKSFVFSNSENSNTINLSGLPRGVYYVYLVNGNTASAKKIIVE